MDPQIPEGYPEAVEPQQQPFTFVPPADLPLETLAIPEWALEKIGGQQSSQAPNPDGAHDPISAAPPTVLEGPELAEQAPEIQGNTQQQKKARRPKLQGKRKAELRNRIAGYLAEDNPARGWKSSLAIAFDVDPAVVSRQVKAVQQEVAA